MSKTAGELLFEAEQSMERGELDIAAQLFEQAHDANPKAPEGAIGMGRIALVLSQFEDAMTILDKVLQYFPKNAEANTYRGLVDEGFGRLPAAIKYYEKAVSLDPKLPVAHFNLGRACGQLNKWKMAVRELKMATRQDPMNVRYWYSLGIAHQEAGDVGEAIEAFSECIEINPLFADGHATLADILVAAERDELAEKILENATGLFSDEGMFHSKLAAMSIRRQDIPGAVQHLRNQTAVDPGNEEAWLSLAVFAMMAEDWETAEEASKNATELNPENWRGFYQLGMVYDAVDLADEAKDALRKAVGNAPDQWEPYNNLANLLMEDSNEPAWREAVEMLDKAMELVPDEEVHLPLFNLALGHYKLGDMSKSKESAQAAVARGPAGDPTVENARKFLGNFE